MSVSYIPDRTKYCLWGKAGGQCEYDGCPTLLWKDPITKAEFNTAYIAHIVADSPKGPRGHPINSEKLKQEISNLMLLCDVHHRLIDKEDVEGHPVELLTKMKIEHEQRVENLVNIQPEKQSEIILYGAKVGNHDAPLNYKKACLAMVPKYFPASSRAIELGMKNSVCADNEKRYWEIEAQQLNLQFDLQVKQRLALGEIGHFSVFGLAPQPLLIQLGRLLSDIPAAEVYQLHREPPDWIWQDHPDNFTYNIIEPETIESIVVLNLSLSATIKDNRIFRALKKPYSSWTVTIDNPNNDFLKSRKQLQMFRETFRCLLDQIKAQHGEDTVIHLFPAAPVAIAIEVGRVWMPKADLPIKIYDQNRESGGFIPALDLSAKKMEESYA